MLVLSRKCDEEIVIGDNVVIRVMGAQGGRVTIGIDAPQDIKILRGEKRETPDLQSPATV